MTVTSFIPQMTLRWAVNIYPHCRVGDRENLKCPRLERRVHPYPSGNTLLLVAASHATQAGHPVPTSPVIAVHPP